MRFSKLLICIEKITIFLFFAGLFENGPMGPIRPVVVAFAIFIVTILEAKNENTENVSKEKNVYSGIFKNTYIIIPYPSCFEKLYLDEIDQSLEHSFLNNFYNYAF